MGDFANMVYAVGEPLRIIATQFAYMVPKILAAALVVLVGYLLGLILGHAAKHALHRLKFDEKFSRLHIAKPLEKIKISVLLGWVVKWYTFVVFVAAGAHYVGLAPLTQLVTLFAEWFPHFVVAMLIGLAGAVVAEYVYNAVMHLSMGGVRVLANIARYFVLVVVIVMALDQIVNVRVLQNVMLVLVGGLALGLAIAIGLSFGLAMKDEAAGLINSIKKK